MLVLSTFVAASAAIASAPAPPMNLPPWQPGMAPPVPGPVFSKAFNALLVLLGMITAKSLRALVQVSSTSVADIFPLLFASYLSAAIGCVLLGINLRDTLNQFYASDLGTDNELLTSAIPGNGHWLKGIQKTNGRFKGHHSSIPMTAVVPRGKGNKSKCKKANPQDEDEDEIIDEDDDAGIEMARLKKKPVRGCNKPSSRTSSTSTSTSSTSKKATPGNLSKRSLDEEVLE